MSEPTESVAVEMGDGTRLATDIYLPSGQGRVPAVLARTPYGKRGNAVWFEGIGRLFANNGLAFVAQDTRGHHGSEGVAAPFEHEPGDGYDTCEWVVRQPWSDGTMAVFGESYVGLTAIAAASSGHPAIRAAALRATTTDIAADWLRHQGVLRLEFVLRWALAAWSGRDNLAPEFDWTIRPLRAIVPAVAPGRVPAILDPWARGAGPGRFSGIGTGWPSLIDKLRVPSHFTTGWWDLFQRGELRDRAHHARHGHTDSRLVIEPTDHAGHDWGDGPTPDPLADFDALAARMPDVLGAELSFLRGHLLGTTGGRQPAAPVTWTLTHVGPQTAASWPPPATEPLRLFLVDAGRAHRGPEGGALSTRPDHIPMESRWLHDPRDLVPSMDGEAIDGWFRQPDERIVQVRDDVITFTSDPIRVPLDLAGPVAAELMVLTQGPGGQVMAKLCDVFPTGEARRIVDGASRVEEGSQRTIVDLGHTGYRLRPGHRLRVEISSSAFPKYIRWSGTRTDPWDAVRTRVVGSQLRTGPNGSSLLLTVMTHRDGE